VAIGHILILRWEPLALRRPATGKLAAKLRQFSRSGEVILTTLAASSDCAASVTHPTNAWRCRGFPKTEAAPGGVFHYFSFQPEIFCYGTMRKNAGFLQSFGREGLFDVTRAYILDTFHACSSVRPHGRDRDGWGALV
jgi:hypothetical protein